jgi:hypothetical protein
MEYLFALQFVGALFDVYHISKENVPLALLWCGGAHCASKEVHITKNWFDGNTCWRHVNNPVTDKTNH